MFQLILKKNQLNVPKKLVLSKKFIFNNYGDILSNSIGKNWEQNFLPSKTNITLPRDKSAAKFFITPFLKVKLNAGLPIT